MATRGEGAHRDGHAALLAGPIGAMASRSGGT